MNIKNVLYSIEMPSTEFSTEAYLDCSGIAPLIRFAYETDGREFRSGIGFNTVSAIRAMAERCCTVWHVEAAYDTLVEIEDSSWSSELRSVISEHLRNDYKLRHFMIYLDSVGSFEFLAESWFSLAPEPVDN